MTDKIPDDLREKAEAVWDSLASRWATGCDPASDIAQALAAERERCAKIAEDEDGHFSQWGEDRNTKVAQQTCADIAAAIRSPS